MPDPNLRDAMIADHAARARRAKTVFQEFKMLEGCDPTAARVALVLAMIETCATQAELDAYRDEVQMIFAAQAVLKDKIDAGEVVGQESGAAEQ